MKPILTKADYNTIKELIVNMPTHLRTKEITLLAREIENAKKVPDSKIEPNIIQLNSTFEIQDIDSGQVLKYQLTLPKEANIAEKKASVLSPLGVALIGFQTGMEIEWMLPGGLKKLKIIDVNSPIHTK